MTNLDEIAHALGEKSRRKSGGGWMVCCPAHVERTPSLSLDIGTNGQLLVKCFGGCENLKVLAALRPYRKSNYIPPQKSKPTRSCETSKEWSEQAESIWSRRLPLTGSIAETYLLSRKCHIPDSDDLGFIDDYKGHAALMARVTCPITNKPITLHFTFLKADGSGKADAGHKGREVLFGHRLKGGVIRLSCDEDVTIGLGIAEGIETALNCQFLPIWATVNADNMSVFPVLDGIECLTIFTDHDKAGICAAEKCASQWRNSNRQARIIIPVKPKTDFADRL